jgi:hypothetical protein
MSTFWAYTVARLGVLAAVLGVLYVAGARGILLIVLAFLVSALLSFWLLAGMRERLASGVEARASRISSKLDEASAAGDSVLLRATLIRSSRMEHRSRVA